MSTRDAVQWSAAAAAVAAVAAAAAAAVAAAAGSIARVAFGKLAAVDAWDVAFLGEPCAALLLHLRTLAAVQRLNGPGKGVQDPLNRQRMAEKGMDR